MYWSKQLGTKANWSQYIPCTMVDVWRYLITVILLWTDRQLEVAHLLNVTQKNKSVSVDVMISLHALKRYRVWNSYGMLTIPGASQYGQPPSYALSLALTN